MNGKVGLLISADVYNEFVLRKAYSVDVAAMVERILRDFLDRTEGDADIWSQEHAQQVAAITSVSDSLGDTRKGYQWGPIFLPNGTELRMKYERKYHLAQVIREELIFNSRPCSPSEMASLVANNTRRNAWRDISIKRPMDPEWIPADALRKRK